MTMTMTMTDDARSEDDDPQPSAWETLNSTPLLRNPWFALRQDQVRLPSGQVLDDFYIWEHPDWVNVVAVTSDRQVVLVEQYRHGLRQIHCELPGGIRDADDPDDETAARRELLEETGYAAESMELLLKSPTSAGMTSEYTHLFHATNLTRQHDGGGVAGEDIAVHLVPKTNLRAWLSLKEKEGLAIDFKIHAAMWAAGI